ncbi:MAG: hypothetical protein SAK29_41865 [Scytonema sp. PMC 1069.18]|nr:hypothetical protein [Scytonema sp. PMC 1069.18]MEC4883692.1 hypothetical protein [Scytonema sp. PMC 1070.18]
MKRILVSAVTVIASLITPAVAKAAIVNGGFENGFENWQIIGDFSAETSAFGTQSVEGQYQAFLSTAFNEVLDIDKNGKEITGGNAAPVTFITGVAENSLEGFLGVSEFFGDDSLAEGIEGSAIKQTFSAEGGETLSFSWNFLTDESDLFPGYNDFAFATLSNGSENLFFKLADTTSNFLPSSNTDFFEETGYQTFSYKIPTSGEYTLGIGVVDVGEPTIISGLLVDKVQTVKAVPEAGSTIGLLFFGTVGVVSVLKRSQRRYSH